MTDLTRAPSQSLLERTRDLATMSKWAALASRWWSVREA